MTQARQSGQLILIIDDDASWRDFSTRVLEDTYPVLAAHSGSEGLRLAEMHKPTLIVLDVMMPGSLDGFAVLCELGKRDETRDTPVVLMSEVNAVMNLDFTPEVLEAQLGHSPAAFLEKPVDVDKLRETVDRLLGVATETRQGQ